MAKRRIGKYPEAFRRMVLERMKNCTSVSALVDELGVHRTALYHWQRQVDASQEGTESRATFPGRELRKQITYSFSKKLDNFKAVVALHFACYNFAKRHSTIRCTPAMAAGVEQSI